MDKYLRTIIREKLMTTAQAAAALDLEHSNLIGLTRRKQRPLDCEKLGYAYVFSRDDIDRRVRIKSQETL